MVISANLEAYARQLQQVVEEREHQAAPGAQLAACRYPRCSDQLTCASQFSDTAMREWQIAS